MKTGKESIEGQIDIFEAMNRAAEAVDRMVEEEQQQKKGNKETPLQRIEGSDMRTSMQKTFENREDGDFATVAYVDYHMVYWKDWNAPAALRKFDTSGEAVNFYFEKLSQLRSKEFAEPAEEHEPLCSVVCQVGDVYVETD